MTYLFRLRSSSPSRAANSFHASLSLANVVASSHVLPAHSKSFLKVLLHAVLGLPCFLLLFDRTHESTVLAHLLSFVWIMCPANFNCQVVIILISLSDSFSENFIISEVISVADLQDSV